MPFSDNTLDSITKRDKVSGAQMLKAIIQCQEKEGKYNGGIK